MLIVVAFVVPLGFLVRRTAEDRAIDAATADASAVVPALVADGTRAQIESAMNTTNAGREARMSIETSQGWSIGSDSDSARLERARMEGVSAIGPVPGGAEVVVAVATGPETISAIRVFVDNDALWRGQWRAWLTLAAVGAVLVGISVIVADRLARTIVRPAEELAAAARRLGDGHLDVTVVPDGPPELLELGGSFNDLGSRITQMLNRERELVAELSHRLRTPLTKLRMRIEHVDDPALAQELAADLDDVTLVVNELIAEARGALGGKSVCDAAAVTINRAEFWRVLAEDQARPWRFVQSVGHLPVAVLEQELAAAVDTLLENVFAHTEEGIPLAIGFGRWGDQARIWVEDGGTGIRAEELATGSSTGGSTGLGLSIAKRTVEAVGGELEIGSGELGGSLVTLVLPLADGTAGYDFGSTAGNGSGSTAGNGSG
ncbi:MAG: ATP-binding protein [Acidimicrobiales bacterium]